MKQINSTQITNPFLYTYTLNGQYDVLTIPNALTRDFNYDDQSRLTSVISTQPPTGNIADFSYAYDLDNYTLQNTMLGQRSSVTSATKKTKYYYDGNYQLNRTDYPTGAPFNGAIHSWTYDPIGNRLTNTVNGTPQNYTYYLNDGNPNNGQRLQSDGTKTYTYDYNGNMVSDGTNSYTWDKDNRLTGITGSLTATYKYDYLGRRFSKTINGGTPSTYIYDGQNLIAERGAATVDYVFGPGIDEPLAMVSGSNQYVYSIDGLGSAAAMTTTTGTLSRTYTYDAWGIIASQTGSIANPFTYTARESADVGLMYYRARYYNPTIGRFVSEDPLVAKKYQLGYLHRYIYVSQNPVRLKDPLGLYEVDATCDCYPPTFGGPNPSPGGHSGLGDKIRSCIKCENIAKTITDPKIKACIETSCKEGTISCKRDCVFKDSKAENEVGTLEKPDRDFYFCPMNLTRPLLCWEYQNAATHEWAHGCGWADHKQDIGVPK